MEKISWDVAFQNTTFFFVDSSIEAFYENEITQRVNAIIPKIAHLNEELQNNFWMVVGGGK